MNQQEVFIFPLSYGQQRLWFMNLLVPESPLFNLNFAIRLRTPVDVPVLEKSLNEIVRRHEILRTTFSVIDEQPVQVISQSLSLNLLVFNLMDLPPMEREAEALRVATEEARRPFDLARGPLLRAALLCLGQDEYIFLLTMHHIVSDGWSMGIFWKELAVLWSAFADGKPSPLPELDIQYADFAVWQRKWFQGEVLNNQLSYWKQRLTNLPVLELPTDRPRPAMQTFRGAVYKAEIPAELAAALKMLSQQEGVTLFMTLLTAFLALLSRYSGQKDIVLGSYIAGRNRAEIEGLIGFFLNTLVMRASLDGDPTFREMLQYVRKMTLEAYANQDVPFARLVEELQPERDLSRNPLFQVMFQMLNVPTLGGQAEPSLLEIDRGTAIFDLSCMLEESGGGLSCQMEYSTDLFDASTIEQMFRHYQTMLEGIIVDPDQHLSNLPLLTPTEKRQILVEWIATHKAYPQDLSIVQRFESRAEENPEATAFICGSERLSYGELNQRANRLAHHLQSLGVGPEVLVGICLERSLSFVTALLGVFKAGGAYLPLDPSYPQERLGFMLKDSGASVLLTEENLSSMFSTYDLRLVCLDADCETIAMQSQENPTNDVSASNLAYVIYTSGSTGKPKGVAVEHEQLLNRFFWMWEMYPFEADEVGCQKTALNFVDSIWELLGPVLCGVPTVIIPERVMQDPERLVNILGEHGVTRIWVVPSFLRMLLDTIPDLQSRLPALKFWVTSGEALTVELLEYFQRVMPECVLFNLYGTSEVWDVTWYDPREHSGASLWRVPIGRPISNMQVYVLDPHLQPVPVGVTGELFVGGVGLARGYLNRPELTAEKFIPHPFRDEPGARLYRTGDLVRYLPDGNLEFIGRIDHLVKLRGFRIELGEVEAVLNQHENVRQAAVIAHEVQPGDQRLIAYLVPQLDVKLSAADLRAFLREKVPEHMVPGAFEFLDSLPLTPSGKVNRRALPGLRGLDTDPEAVYNPPRNEIERAIAAVWQEVLQVERVSIYDNFFDLGGHSLLMFQVYSKLRNVLAKELTMNDMFRYPTINALANYCSQEQAGRLAFSSIHQRTARQKQARARYRRSPVGEQHE